MTCKVPAAIRTGGPIRVRRGSYLALLASLAFYFAIGTFDLRQPGLQYDEAYDALPALELLDGSVPSCAESVRVGGVHLPLMMHPHIGPTSAYTSLATFGLLGASVESLRLGQLVVGAIGLVLLLLVARRWFDDRCAAIAVVLCGTAPAYIWWSRGGANWTVPLVPLSLGMLLSITGWWRQRRRPCLLLAAFLFAAGVTTKILFVWLALPIALTALIGIGPRRLFLAVRKTPPWVFAGAALALVAGLAPLIAHNWDEPRTLNHVLRSGVTTSWGHDNRSFVANLLFVIRHFLWMIDGEVLMNAPIAGSSIGRAALVLAILFTGARLLSSARSAPPRLAAGQARLFLLAVPLTVLPQSTVTTSALSATYLFLIVPLVWLLVASAITDGLFLASISAARPVRVIARGAAVGVLVALVANHVSTNFRLLSFFDQTGGRGLWSDAIYRTAEVLEDEFPGRPVIALDWGFRRNIELVTARRVRVTEGHEFLPTPSARFAERCSELLAQADAVFLVHAQDTAICRSCFDVCRTVARSEGRDLALRYTIRDREGRPNTFLYTSDGARSLPAQPPMSDSSAACLISSPSGSSTKPARTARSVERSTAST